MKHFVSHIIMPRLSQALPRLSIPLRKLSRLVNGVTHRVSPKQLDLTSFVPVSQHHKRILVCVVGSDGLFHKKQKNLNFLSVCCDEGIDLEGVPRLCKKLTHISPLKYHTFIVSQFLWVKSLPRVAQGWNPSAAGAGSGFLPSSLSCWQNSRPWGCGTHGSFFLQGWEERDSLTWILSLQGRPGSFK